MPDVQKIAVLVNESCHQGQAGLRWEKVREEVLAHLPAGTQEQRFRPPFDPGYPLRQLVEGGANCFISAGGDGSANFLLNELMHLREEGKGPFFLGGIGLGSSNDFIKPVGQKLAGLPVRMDWQTARPADVGQVVFEDENDVSRQVFFIVNASLGVTATANYYFNHPDFLLKKLKQYRTGGAIIWAALRTILRWKNLPAHLVFNGVEEDVALSNLAVLKNPHVSGDFRYDQPIRQDDGWLGLNYCTGMSRFELVKTLADLLNGRFSGKPGRHSVFIKNLQIQTTAPVPLETDGEVCLAKNIRFSVLPQAIHLLGHGIPS
jgi:diacylglycerol kinase family enzyme